MRLFITAALGVAASGCAHGVFVPNADTIIAARDSWMYAQLAANAYGDQWFDLPPSVELVENCENDAFGYAYKVFARGAGPKEVIIAFRGTEDRLDWRYGNTRRVQNERGVRTVAAVRARFPGSRIVLAGHSLGGGIANHASLRLPVDAVCTVNSSSNYSKPANYDAVNDRVARRSLKEIGEVNYAVRAFGRPTTLTSNSLNCLPGFAPVRQHSSARLAACLTDIAATAGDPLAVASRSANGWAFPYWRRDYTPAMRQGATLPCHRERDFASAT